MVKKTKNSLQEGESKSERKKRFQETGDKTEKKGVRWKTTHREPN